MESLVPYLTVENILIAIGVVGGFADVFFGSVSNDKIPYRSKIVLVVRTTLTVLRQGVKVINAVVELGEDLLVKLDNR
jgi:hypothetical protein